MIIDEKHIARLIPEAKEMLDKSLEDKIFYIQEDRWIPYPQAKQILDKLESLLKMPNKVRAPSMLITGDSHCGKSSLVRHFRDLHPPTDGMYEATCPVFYLESCPPEPDEGRLYENILKSLMIPFRSSDKPAKKMDEARYQFQEIQVKMIILDEIGHSLSGSSLKQRVLMNSLKELHNEMHRPIILVGALEAQYATSSDKQFGSRFKTELLPRWEYNEDFLIFLVRLELTLPFRKGSVLADTKLSKLIYDKAESGCIGDYVDLVSAAAIMAIETGSEQITGKEIKDCTFTPSSKRQPPAEISGT